jgi:hypothetical protein
MDGLTVYIFFIDNQVKMKLPSVSNNINNEIASFIWTTEIYGYLNIAWVVVNQTTIRSRPRRPLVAWSNRYNIM